MEKKKTGIFTTLDGKEYTIIGFTRMMMMRVEEAVKTSWELEEKRPLPKRPTYSVSGDDAFGGEEIVYYHTKETLETEEDKKAWDEYEALQAELDARVWKHMMYEAMNCVHVPLDELKRYVVQYKRDTGILLPNPEESEVRVKRLYVEDLVLCDDTEEMMRLLSEAMGVAGVISNEEAAKAMDSFRGQQAEQGGEPAERQDTAEEAGDS